MGNNKKCEVCGELKSHTEFSKSYKKRCKPCVAEHTRNSRKSFAGNNKLDPNVEYIEKLITSLRESDVYIRHIFMRGGCYRFYLFLKCIFPNGEPYITKEEDHIAIKINNRLFDIRGSIDSESEKLYRPLEPSDLIVVSSWSFSRNQLLQICECPHCGEPIIYDDEYEVCT